MHIISTLFYNHSIIMGNKNIKKEIAQPTPQELDKYIADLLSADPEKYTIQQIQPAILNISRSIITNGSLGKKQQKYWANPTILKTIFHARFEQSVKGMLKLLVYQIKKIFLSSRFINLVPRDTFQKCLNIAKFIVFFTDEALIKNIGLLNIRSDIHPQTKHILNQLNAASIELNSQVFQNIQQEQLIGLVKDIRISLVTMIDLHNKLLTRSDFTMKFIDILGQCLFMVYCKLFFQVKDVQRKERLENESSIFKLSGAYAGIGLDKGVSPIYQASVLLLLNLLKNKKPSQSQIKKQVQAKIKKIKALPSHIFKTLPVITSGQLFTWLVCIIIYGLSYIKQNDKFFSRLNANRIPTFKLLSILIQKYECHNPQITYLLESLCLQIKPQMIQRVYLCEITDKYSKLQTSSAIISKYSSMKNVAFNVKSKKKSLTFKPDQVMTQLQSDQQGQTKQINHVYNKFVHQMILHRYEIRYEYGDKALWSLIISQRQQQGYENNQSEQKQQRFQKHQQVMQYKQIQIKERIQ